MIIITVITKGGRFDLINMTRNVGEKKKDNMGGEKKGTAGARAPEQFLTVFFTTAKITRKALNVEFHFYMIFA